MQLAYHPDRFIPLEPEELGYRGEVPCGLTEVTLAPFGRIWSARGEDRRPARSTDGHLDVVLSK